MFVRRPSFAHRELPLTALLALALSLLSGALAPAPAAADIRVWETGVDEESGEVTDPKEHRWLDLTAFAQPGFVLRFADENAGRTDNTFLLQRARSGFKARLTWWLRMRMEVEFAPTAQLQDAYLELTPHPWAHLRVGQFLVPFLRAYQFNELNLGFLDRPIYTPQSGFRRSIRYLSPRDVGAQLSGRIGDLTEGATSPVFEYWLGTFLGRGSNQIENGDDAFLYAARFQLHLLGLPEGVEAESDIARNARPRVAVAGSLYSNCDDRANWNRGWNADAEFRWNGIYASASFVWFKNGPAADGQFGYDFCTGSDGPDGNPLRFVSRGAHMQLQYVLPDALFPVPGQDLELLARYDWVDANSPFDPDSPILGGDEDSPQYVAPETIDNSDNPPTRYRLTFGVNWFPTGKQTLRIQLNYQINRETEDMVTAEGRIRGVRNEIVWLQITAGL
ncbi:MAG TPA: hypothetical protein RMH85_20715 [Polyangiaceae bacterium LLY-WYZ-15_(1-7)]|nr:hypothetical protein [Sandaracinus sp.]HJK92620.1 hypothetical protein [Polyangiaceae bacterium LLY-WYZ-15_(1-7)]HJL06196.1 hypothetical protein [Polyangiaceae bacterium LLY-WYZ-15_(1-7)]HJL10909.1 hypothetical protein [Polyangiaceae bacterium LLY-WYZ-15_(1-7)]HJL26638.1 hypothetical protein [Polyangiaceae bacterium LLY-WYZ-15_(1-7)]